MPLLVRMYLEQRWWYDTCVDWKLPSVYQSVQHLSSLLNQVWLIGIILQLIIRLQVEDHVQRLSVVGNLLIETSQVKLVLDVVLVHLAEELIAAQTTEPRDPGYLATRNKLDLVNCHNPSPSQKSKVKSQKSKGLGVTLFCCATHPPTKNFSQQLNIQLSSNFHSRLTWPRHFESN